LLPHKLETDVLVDQPQQMGFRNLVFQAEIVEQRFRAVVLPIMISRPPTTEIQRSMSPSNMLLLNLTC